MKDKLASYISVEGNLIGADCGLISRRTISYSFETFPNKMFDELIAINKSSEEYSARLWAEMLEKCHPLAFYKSSESLVEWSDSNRLLECFINLKSKKAYIYGDKNCRMDILNMLGDISKVAVPGSGHFVMNDNPNEFYKEVSKLVNGMA
jgi:pimeloyl-ACP methyl ester carboxylesterase